MKKFLIAANIVIWGLVSYELAHAEAEVKKVCHDVNGKQVCKNVKVHKKVEGTPVPEKAPTAKNPAKK
jgi:hypothetical protein